MGQHTERIFKGGPGNFPSLFWVCSKILTLVSNLKGNGSRGCIDAPPKAAGISSQLKEKLTQVSNVICFQEQMGPLSPGKCLCPWKLELA